MTTAILGIQPDYNGLRIEPCIPDEWDGFFVSRQFRDKTFNIKVTNGEKGKGIKEMILNGEIIDGNLIPISKMKNENIVEIKLL